MTVLYPVQCTVGVETVGSCSFVEASPLSPSLPMTLWHQGVTFCSSRAEIRVRGTLRGITRENKAMFKRVDGQARQGAESRLSEAYQKSQAY